MAVSDHEKQTQNTMGVLDHEKPSQNANDIGWAFVPQYYNFVNKDPSRLHCFYTKQSALIHGTEGEEVPTCYGQQEIHQKIMSVGFDDCKVFVSTVDSMSSADSGIIVQVLGEMSNANGPWRKFAQTFFLAEQPNGFFVLNDIFRYLKDSDDDVSDSEPEPAAVVPEATSQPSPPQNNTTAASRSVTEDDHVKAEVDEIPAEAPPAPSVQPAADEPPQLNGYHPGEVDDVPSSKATSNGTTVKLRDEPVPTPDTPLPAATPSAPELSGPNSTVDLEQKVSNVTLTEPGHDTSDSVLNNGPSPVPVVNIPEPSQPSAPPAPKTWASLAASGKSKWSGNLSASQGVSSSPITQSGSDHRSTLTTTAASTTSTTLGSGHLNNSANAGSSGTRRDERYIPIDAITTGSCFIKGVNENVDDRVLREALVKRFGPIKGLDIVRSKACAFLEFERVESAKKAIQLSMPYHLGGEGGIAIGPDNHIINIETKRQPGERGRPADAGPKRGGMQGGERGGSGRGGFISRGRGGGDGGDRGSNRGNRGRGGFGRGVVGTPPQQQK